MASLYKTNTRIITIITSISLVFLLMVTFDIIPLLRGPAPYPPEWRWGYYFVNTLNKVWAPLIVGLCLLLFAFFIETKNEKYIKNKEIVLMSLLIILSFLFQISVLHWGRSGVGVLLQRTIDPQSSGYFTISTKINNLSTFLSNYGSNVLSYPGHVRGHPPGMIILYWLINRIFLLFPYLNSFTDNLSFGNNHVRLLWSVLPAYQKTGAILSGAIITFISNLVIIPIYFFVKYLTNIKTAERASILYVVVPSFVLFIPMVDIIIPIFSVLTIFLFIKSQKEKKLIYSIISGLIFSLGLFFSLSIFPLLLFIFFILSFQFLYNHNKNIKFLIKSSLLFLFNFILFQVLLFVLFGYNFIDTANKIMLGLAPRSYIIWLFYDIYDFFIFAGIPILILSALIFKNLILDILRKQYKRLDLFTASFFAMLLILDISGTCRAETGRIWLPYIPILIMIISKYITNDLKFNKYAFTTVLGIQIIQILIMQEFLVMYW